LRQILKEQIVLPNRTTLRRFWMDDRGGEVIEWALIAGLLVAAAIATITAVGTRVLAKWTTIDSSL
jgi:Flp pilus assembly pilin Flp